MSETIKKGIKIEKLIIFMKTTLRRSQERFKAVSVKRTRHRTVKITTKEEKWLFIREQPFGTCEKDISTVLKKISGCNNKMTKAAKLLIYFIYIYILNITDTPIFKKKCKNGGQTR